MAHIWVCHVTHMNESCHTCEWVMSHIWMSRVTHMNESCHTYEWLMSHMWMSHGSTVYEKKWLVCRDSFTCYMQEMTHTLLSHVIFSLSLLSHDSFTCVTWVTHMWMSHGIRMGHATRLNESCDTHEWELRIWKETVSQKKNERDLHIGNNMYVQGPIKETCFHEKTLMTRHLWKDIDEKTLMKRHIWQDFYENTLTKRHLWKGFMKKYLRKDIHEKDVYEKHIYGQILMKRHWWQKFHSKYFMKRDLSKSHVTHVAVCCSVLQCVAVFCSVLQCVAVCCSAVQLTITTLSPQSVASVLQCVAMCCSVLPVCCSVLQCVAVCWTCSENMFSALLAFHTNDWDMPHTWTRHVTHVYCVTSHTWTSHATNMSDVTHMNVSCHMYERVTSHTWASHRWVSHVAYMNESR